MACGRAEQLIGFALVAMLVLVACTGNSDPMAPGSTPSARMETPSQRLSPVPAASTPSADAAGTTPVPPTTIAVPSTQTAAPSAARAAGQGEQGGPPVELRPFLSGLEQPLYVTHAGDGSGDLYIVERGGVVKVARNGVLRSEPFLDISSRVGSGAYEQGLLGLAFHPSYQANGYFYVNYTDQEGSTRIERYTAYGDRGVGDPTSAKLILQFEQPFANHNGGNLVFGPDGMLWIGTGDGGSAGDPRGNGQNRGVLLGKMLRIDVDGGDPYAIPSDNPFVNQAGTRPEIWALGLRNPWRYSFDRRTGDLYIADVGQAGWEEVSFLPAGTPGGLNFGWNRMEGTHCYPPRSSCDPSGLTLPVTEYATHREGCSVTGGYVYRGKTYPAMAGYYYFTDFCSGTLWSLWHDERGAWQRTTKIPSPGGSVGFSSFGEDEAGELYVTDLNKGIVYRLVQRVE